MVEAQLTELVAYSKRYIKMNVMLVLLFELTSLTTHFRSIDLYKALRLYLM